MGSWGTAPLENDGALDLKSEWDETKDVLVLESALDSVLSLKAKSYLDAMDGEAGIAAVHIIVNQVTELHNDQLKILLKKSAVVIGRVLENSELQELWSETDSFGDWLTNITQLMQQITEKLQDIETS